MVDMLIMIAVIVMIIWVNEANVLTCGKDVMIWRRMGVYNYTRLAVIPRW